MDIIPTATEYILCAGTQRTFVKGEILWEIKYQEMLQNYYYLKYVL